MQCEAFNLGRCQSCPHLNTPYEAQLATKQSTLEAQLLPFAPAQILPPVASAVEGFRNKAKMQVLGFAHAPVLGIVNTRGEAVSLCDCPLYPPAMQAVLHFLESWIKTAGLTPYRIDKQKGELKYLLLTWAQDTGEMMLRFVLRSRAAIAQIESYLPLVQRAFPSIKVISANIQPVHMAVIEGEEEHFFTAQEALHTALNGVPLFIRPKSFFQTNTAVAARLYAQAQAWMASLNISHVWDLFCGVGGFGLHAALTGASVTGIEIEPEAIACAKRSAALLGRTDIRFEALDAATFRASNTTQKDLIIVNPPRRGVGEALCGMIEASGAAHLLYSSCNLKTLVQDAARLKSFRMERVQLFDMFPHTDHEEVLVLFTRIHPTTKTATCPSLP